MTYTVNWKLTAIQQLDRLIAAAADPQSVRQAAAFIDYALRRNPATWASPGRAKPGSGTRTYSGSTTPSITRP